MSSTPARSYKRLAISIVIAAIIVAAIVLIVATQTPEEYTGEVACTNSITLTYLGSTTAGTAPPAPQTETEVTTYTTTTNTTATVNHITVATITSPLLTGRAVTTQSCTYIK